MRQFDRKSHFMATAALNNVEANVNCTHRLPLSVSEEAPPFMKCLPLSTLSGYYNRH